MFKKILFGATLLALTCKTVKAQTLPLDSEVRTGKLRNGFTYFIRRNTEPKNRVVFYLANKVGSVLESDDQQGLAHFMEHMNFNGTTNFPHNELVSYLQKVGVRFGADLNAYTNFDETVYKLPIPSDNPELMKNGIQIMRDWAHGATLDPMEIDKERGVILEEKRLKKGAGERLQKQYMPVIMNHSRYAKRFPIGTDSILNNFKPEAIQRFYHDWYRPDLQALIVVGDIDVDSMENVIKAKFADLENPPKERLRIKYTIPLTGKNQFIALTDKEQTTIDAAVIIKGPSTELKTEKDFRSAMIRNLFNNMLAHRYSELSKLADPPFRAGTVSITGFTGDLSSYNVSVVAKPGEMERGFKGVWREQERVKQLGFTQTELDRAKKAYMNRMESAYNEKGKIISTSYVNEYLNYFLNGTAAPGIEKEYRLVKQNLADINLKEVNNLSRIYNTSANRDIVIMAPEKDKGQLPDEKTIINWMQNVEAEKLLPYKDEVSTQTLLIKPLAAPGKIIGEQKDEKLGITTITLNNGIKIILKPTDFQKDQVTFNGFAPGGTSLYSDSDYQSAVHAADIISASGVGNYTSNQLQKFLSGKSAGVSFYIHERFQGVTGGATNNELETAMQLVYAYFTEPRKDNDVFHNIIDRYKAGIVNRSNSPVAVFSDSVSAILGNYNFRRTGPTLAKINQINLDKAFEIYKERFADAANFTFTFVGSIDTARLKPLLEKYLGSLPSTYKKEEAKNLDIHIPEGKITKLVYKGTEPKTNFELVLSGLFDYTLDNNVQMDALKEVLLIRLTERLREEESGVYTPSVQFSSIKYPQSRFSLIVSFTCSPQNVNKLLSSTLDEIRKLKTEGPQQINIDKYKAGVTRSREIFLNTNNYWLNYINSQLQNKESLYDVDNYKSSLEKVTVLSIKQYSQKYLSEKNQIVLELMPETAKP